jgi:hypothetical protein
MATRYVRGSKTALGGALVVLFATLAWSQLLELPKAPDGVNLKKWYHAHVLWFGRVFPYDHRALEGSLVIEVIWETPEYREAGLAFAAVERGREWVLDYLERTKGMTVWEVWMRNRTGRVISLNQFPSWRIRIVDDLGRIYKLVAWDNVPRSIPPKGIYGKTLYTEEVNREKFRSVTLSFESPESGEVYTYRWSSDIFDQYYKRDPSMIYWHMAAYRPEVFKQHLNLERDVFPYWRNKYGLKEGEPYPKTNP